MKRCSFVRGNSKAIFSISYADLTSTRDMADINNYLGSIIEKMPKNSMLILLDLRRLALSGEYLAQLKEMFERYCRYFGHGAVVADQVNESKVRNLIKSLGYSKMLVYEEPQTAMESLFAID
jgi:hypothetical protein